MLIASKMSLVPDLLSQNSKVMYFVLAWIFLKINIIVSQYIYVCMLCVYFSFKIQIFHLSLQKITFFWNWNMREFMTNKVRGNWLLCVDHISRKYNVFSS